MKWAYYIHPESDGAFIDTDPLEGTDGMVEWIGEVGTDGPSREDFERVAKAANVYDWKAWADRIDFSRLPTMTSTDFITLLQQHDWYFDRSDDSRAYAKGRESQKRLLYLCQQQPELFRLYNHAENCIIRALPFDFQSITGSPVMVEKQHTQTPTHPAMKELFQSIFETLIKPLIDAIDRNTASKGGCSASVADSPAPAAEKPAKAAKAAKPAAPPATPAEEAADEPAAPEISEARLKATVMTLPNEGKAKLKAYFVKKFGYNTMAEIAAEHRADIHAAAVKIGATDTDPEAEVEM